MEILKVAISYLFQENFHQNAKAVIVYAVALYIHIISEELRGSIDSLRLADSLIIIYMHRIHILKFSYSILSDSYKTVQRTVWSLTVHS